MLPSTESGHGPALVLLHAGVADRRMWDQHIEPLALAGYRVIACDLPGFGEAPIHPGEQAPWTDVFATLDALGVRAMAVVGCSFGGAVALRMAAVAPQRMWAMAVVSAPAPGLEPSFRLANAWAEEEQALERGDVDAAVAAVVRTWTLPDAPAALREQVATMQRHAFASTATAPPTTEAPDPLADRAELAGIDVPTLVLDGDRDLSDFRDGARLLADAIPGAEASTLTGAGHLAPLETPQDFRQRLLTFLAEHRPGE